MSARFVLRCGTASGFVVVVIVICNTPGIGQAAESGKIPHELWGKWLVVRELNTRTISCWGNQDAKKVLQTTIEYSSTTVTWRKLQTKADAVEVRTVTPGNFKEENSSPSSSGSQIDFQQLGIKSPSVEQISIRHAAAQITQATTEFPGDEVLVKNSDEIVFSMCNLYFEAKRKR